MDPKIDLFCQSWYSCFDNFWVKKPVFWTFWKLVWSCSGVVWGLFLALKGLLLGVFSGRKVDKWPLKLKFRRKFWLSERVILRLFWGQKITFLEFSKVLLELFKSSLGIVFLPFRVPRKPYTIEIRRILILKTKILPPLRPIKKFFLLCRRTDGRTDRWAYLPQKFFMCLKWVSILLSPWE